MGIFEFLSIVNFILIVCLFIYKYYIEDHARRQRIKN